MVDTTAPQTAIDWGPSGTTSNSSPRLSFSSEAWATFECQLDGGAWKACASPYAVSDLADGAHTFSVRAVDAAGNVDATRASLTCTVDATAPETTIDTGPSGATRDASPSFEFSS